MLGMDLLRIVLFLGMVFHKLVWEVMKRREGAPGASRKSFEIGPKSALKLLKSLFLVFLIVQTLFLDFLPISDQPNTLRIVGLIIFFTGLAISVTGRIQLGNNWVDLEDFQVLPEQKLVKSGIYRYIRHPIYTGDTLLVIGLELALNSWLVIGALCLIPIIYKQALDEETVLSQAFPDYEDYKKETKMFVPYLV